MLRVSSASRADTVACVLSRLTLFLFLALVSSLVLLAAPVFAQWTVQGPYAKSIRALAAAPDNANVFFAGAFGWGIFKSVDGGTTWTNYDAGLTNKYVRSIAARTSLVLLCGTNDGINRSTDGGMTWTQVQPTAFSTRALAYDPVTGHWFAGTYGDDFYRSTDDGITWTKHIVFDPISGETLHRIRACVRFGADSVYVGGSIGDVGAGGALFASYDGGMTWVQVQQSIGVRSSITAISASPNVPATSVIFGTAARGMYKSTDGGLTILNINGGGTLNPLPDSTVEASAFSSGFRITATGTLGAVFLRALGDTTVGWLSTSGLPGALHAPQTLLSYASGIGLLAGLDEVGVYRSIDSGHTFVAANSGLMGTDVRSFAFTTGGRIVAGTGFGDQIFYSDNDGVTWTRASVASFNSIFQVAAAADGALYAAQYASGVLKSTDAGVTWLPTDTAVINRFVRAVSPDPFNSSTIYAGTGNGVFKSLNAGLSWSAANDGTIPFSTSIRSMALSSLTPGLLLAGSDVDFLYRSTDGGASWSHLDSTVGFLPQDPFIRCLRFDPLQANVVYAGGDSAHIYRSTDAGATWNLLVNLPAHQSVREIVVDPGNSSRIMAATYGSGVYVSEDAGQHWHSYNDGLSDLQLSTLAIRPGTSPLELWAGSGHGGAQRRTYNGLAANHPPTLSGPAAASVTAGGTLDLTYIADDPDLADTMTFNVTGPGAFTGLSGYPPDTAAFTWATASADTLGSPYTLTVIVQDGVGGADTVVTSIAVAGPAQYIVGDVNADGSINSSDIIYLVNYVFKGGLPPMPLNDAGDANCDLSVTSSDIIFLVNYVFRGGPKPACGG